MRTPSDPSPKTDLVALLFEHRPELEGDLAAQANGGREAVRSKRSLYMAAANRSPRINRNTDPELVCCPSKGQSARRPFAAQPCDPLFGPIFCTIRERYGNCERTVVTRLCVPDARIRPLCGGFLLIFNVLGKWSG